MSDTRTSINFGVTIPKPAYEKLERARGYCSRSKFILMALDSLAAINENMSQYPQVTRPKDTETNAESIQTQEPMIDNG